MFKNKYLHYVCCAMISACASAQNFPTKPVRFVIGPAPELLPRLVSQRLSEMWGYQVVVDQRPGAGGIVAGDLVSKATPDGYTWLMSTGSFYVIDALYSKLAYNMVRDFAPVTLMATIPFIAVVHPSVPAKSLAELVQLAKVQPGKLNFASAGTGTTTQLAAELFKLSAKIDIVHVPYKGVAPAVTEVLAGQVQMMFAVAQGAVPHVQSGKLRALAITSLKRSPAAPEVPTIIEAGFPEIDIVGWNGVSVPIKTPRMLVNKLNIDIRKILNQKEMQERMIAAGFDPVDTTLEQFEAFIKKDVALYHRIIRESKLKLD
jgi:tripartite-type tricarboxylate transporter receptor subunit TctC